MHTRVKSLLLLGFTGLLLLVTGCQSSNQRANTSTAQQTPSAKPPQLNSNDFLIIQGTSGEDLWSLYRNVQEKQLKLYQAEDDGKRWSEAILNTKQEWEYNAPIENIFTMINTKKSKLASWILLTSDPAAGLMQKSLYSISQSGNATFINDLSNQIDGYPTGLTFRDDHSGWIAATYHGKSIVPLFHTKDGGHTWTVQEVPVPQGYKYGNAFPPRFESPDSMKGTLSVQFVNDEHTITQTLATTDGGETWQASAP